MRSFILASALAATCLTGSAVRAASDIPYWKLNYAKYDYTYEWEVKQADKFAAFRWDALPYCRYPTGWNGPGAYVVGTRFKRGFGWNGGYPWQGPGTVEDHDDEEDYAEAQAAYRHDVRQFGECVPRRHVHRRSVVLRRKD